MNKYLSPEELAINLSISKMTIYNWIYQRKIPFFKIGRLVRFREEDIERWLKTKEIKMPD